MGGFFERLRYLLTYPIAENYTALKALYWASNVKYGIDSLDDCGEYIDGSLVQIACPYEFSLQAVV